MTQLFDAIAIRIAGDRAWSESFNINWTFTDSGRTYWMELSNGALIHYPITTDRPTDLTINLTKSSLLGLLANGSTDGIEMSGDASVLARLMAAPTTQTPTSPS